MSTARAEIVAERWVADPCAWAIDCGFELRPWQMAVLEAVADPTKRKLAVRGVRGSGKSTLLAMVALWRATTRPGSLTVIVTGVQRQLAIGVWAEIRRLWAQSEALRSLFPDWRILADSIDTGSPDHRVLAMASDSVYNLEGAHGQHVAVLLDECRSIPDDVYKSVRALLLGPDTLLFAAGTAGPPRGWWYRVNARDGRDLYDELFVIAADEVAGLDERMTEERKLLGANDPVFLRDWCNNFTDAAEASLYDLATIEKCFGVDPNRPKTFMPILGSAPQPRLTLGCDVARSGGDANVVCLARGRKIEGFVELPGGDLMGTVGRIVNLAKERAAATVGVDVIGLGAGVHDRLREVLRGSGVRVSSFAASERATDAETYANRKAELAVKARRMMEAGEIGLPRHEGLIRDLLGAQTRITSNGRLRLEDPADSPDFFDAMLVALSDSLTPPSAVAVHASWL